MSSQISEACAEKRTKSIFTESLFLTMKAITQSTIKTSPMSIAYNRGCQSSIGPSGRRNNLMRPSLRLTPLGDSHQTPPEPGYARREANKREENV